MIRFCSSIQAPYVSRQGISHKRRSSGKGVVGKWFHRRQTSRFSEICPRLRFPEIACRKWKNGNLMMARTAGFRIGGVQTERLGLGDFCLSAFPPDSCRSALRRSDQFRSSERLEAVDGCRSRVLCHLLSAACQPFSLRSGCRPANPSSKPVCQGNS